MPLTLARALYVVDSGTTDGAHEPAGTPSKEGARLHGFREVPAGGAVCLVR